MSLGVEHADFGIEFWEVTNASFLVRLGLVLIALCYVYNFRKHFNKGFQQGFFSRVFKYFFTWAICRLVDFWYKMAVISARGPDDRASACEVPVVRLMLVTMFFCRALAIISSCSLQRITRPEKLKTATDEAPSFSPYDWQRGMNPNRSGKWGRESSHLKQIAC